MSELDGIEGVWELGYRELGVAFEGLPDDLVRRRPTPGVLSIGELAGHIAITESVCLTGPGPDFVGSIDGTPVKSWLIDANFYYLPKSLENPPEASMRTRQAPELAAEAKRVHEETLRIAEGRGLTLSDPVPGWTDRPLWGAFLRYIAFHVGYHVGQIYTVRHLLGDKTPDN